MAAILAFAGLVFLAGGAGLIYAAMRGQKTEVIQQVKWIRAATNQRHNPLDPLLLAEGRIRGLQEEQ